MRFVHRKLTPAQEQAVRIALNAGADRNALANAYDVHVRTIDRTRERGAEQFVEVEVAGYRATFVLDQLGPVQRTPWVPA